MCPKNDDDRNDDDSDGDWVEYRRLILKELQNLSDFSQKHSQILIEIEKTLLRQAEMLDDHMARTEAAEKRIEMLQTEIKPLVRASWMASMFFKIGAGLATIIGTVVAVIELYSKFHP